MNEYFKTLHTSPSTFNMYISSYSQSHPYSLKYDIFDIFKINTWFSGQSLNPQSTLDSHLIHLKWLTVQTNFSVVRQFQAISSFADIIVLFYAYDKRNNTGKTYLHYHITLFLFSILNRCFCCSCYSQCIEKY